MDITTLLWFSVATFVLIATPGPVVGLILAETIKHGPRFGIAVVLGAETVGIAFLALYNLGAAPLIIALDAYIPWIQAIGIAYLFYTGITTLLAKDNVADNIVIKARKPIDAYKSAVIVTGSSPKTILFFAAFFPQFLNFEANIPTQLLILSATFVFLTAVLDLTWVLIAKYAKSYIEKRGMKEKLNVISGSILCLAAVLLAVIDL